MINDYTAQQTNSPTMGERRGSSKLGFAGNNVMNSHSSPRGIADSGNF